VLASLLGLAVVLFLACRHSDTAQAQGTTAQIARAVEMLRLSSNHDKHPWLDRLRALPCQAEDACQLQATCIGAYEEHLRALELIESARQRLDIPARDAAVEDASAEALLQTAAQAQSAQRMLREARRLTRACAENEAVIRQRYRL
jgi:hypothetical protein